MLINKTSFLCFHSQTSSHEQWSVSCPASLEEKYEHTISPSQLWSSRSPLSAFIDTGRLKRLATWGSLDPEDFVPTKPIGSVTLSSGCAEGEFHWH